MVALSDRGPGSGGGERVAADLAMRLDPDRFESTLCVTRASASHDDLGVASGLAALRDAGVRIISLDRRSAADLRAWGPLVGTLRRERIDVLHGHKFGSNVWAAVLGSLAAVPVVIAHEHNWSYEGQPTRRLIDRELIGRRADAFVAVSRQGRTRMLELERIDPAKVVLIPNGIADVPAGSNGSDLRAELGIGADDLVLGTVTVLRAEKALEVLIDAARTLRVRFPNLRVLIVGTGPRREELERLVERLGLEETVLLIGHREDVPTVLAALDVAICCSDFEGTPLSVLEYMDAGVPVVATSVGGLPDMVTHQEQGLLVPPRDPAALATAVAELLADPGRRAQMGARAQERRRREFGIGEMVARVERLYEDLLEAKASRG